MDDALYNNTYVYCVRNTSGVIYFIEHPSAGAGQRRK